MILWQPPPHFSLLKLEPAATFSPSPRSRHCPLTDPHKGLLRQFWSQIPKNQYSAFSRTQPGLLWPCRASGRGNRKLRTQKTQ